MGRLRWMGKHLRDVQEALGLADVIVALPRIADKIWRAWEQHRTIFLAGNGGSFATALHAGNDLQKFPAPGVGDGIQRPRTHVLGANPALLTAYSNDHGYPDALAHEFWASAKASDLLIALSCSGRSGNIRGLFIAAEALNVHRVLLTGQAPADLSADVILRVPSDDVTVIEDVHLVLMHAIAIDLRHRFQGTGGD